MKFTVSQWPISKLRDSVDELDLSPRYQRGEAWKEEKQGLLVDTILMGYDIPKIYLARNTTSALSKYDVVDGQQRLHAIFRFLGIETDNKGKALRLRKRWGLEWSDQQNLEFDTLTDQQKARFLAYEVTVTTIEGASNDQLRRLFLRLQMGSTLNQAELRNALASATGDHINAIVENHQFFKISAIPIGRYKRQDYLCQALVFCKGKLDSLVSNVDAKAAKQFYLNENGVGQSFWTRVQKVLDLMESISSRNPRCFYNKWMFVDFFCYFWLKQISVESINPSTVAERIMAFESKRLSVKRNPEALIGQSGSAPRLLLGYVDAFYRDGGLGKNLEKRLAYLESIEDELFK